MVDHDTDRSVARKRANSLFKAAVDEFFNTVAPNFAEMQFWLQMMAPGHPGCNGAPQRVQWFQWDAAESRNRYVRKQLRQSGLTNVRFVDIHDALAQRPDAHPAGRFAYTKKLDCLHYCSPGPFSPINLWRDVIVTGLAIENT